MDGIPEMAGSQIHQSYMPQTPAAFFAVVFSVKETRFKWCFMQGLTIRLPLRARLRNFVRSRDFPDNDWNQSMGQVERPLPDHLL